jgi:hypothetical protein
MHQNNIQLIVILGIIGIIMFYTFSSIGKSKFLEGMENATTSTQSLSNGLATNAPSFATSIKANAAKIQDTLLIKKYRKDYENVILGLDDYIDNMMLKTILEIGISQNNIDETDFIKKMEKLNTLKQSKDALNATIKFVDSQ